MIERINKSSIIYLTVTLFFSLVYLYFDINYNENLLKTMLESESSSLVKTVSANFSNSMKSIEVIESEILNKFEVSANIFSMSNDNFIKNNSHDYDFAAVYSYSSSLVIFHPRISHQDFLSYYKEDLEYLIDEKIKWMELGFNDSLVQSKDLYLYAYNDEQNKRIIILGIDASPLKAYRMDFGIGKQSADITNSSDIHYIILLDNQGVIAASGHYQDKIQMVNYDSISKVLDNNQIIQNYFKSQDSLYLELIKSFTYNESEVILRLGLDLDNFNKLISAANLRAYIIAGVFIAVNFFIILILSYRKSFQFMRKERNKIKLYNDKILENMSDGLIACSSDGNIILSNKFALNFLNVSLEQIITRNIKDYFDISSEKAFEINYNNRILSFASASFTDVNNQLLNIFIFRDITENRLLAETAKRKEKITAMGELAAQVAHEIRNPLNSISVIAQRFQYEFEPLEYKEEYFSLVNVIRGEIERVNKIIKQFLEFAKPPKMNIAAADINKILEECSALFASSFNEKNISFKNLSNIEMNYLTALDYDKIKQALINLIQNAIEAVNDGGEIIINSKIENNELIIQVIDNGSGIEKDKIDKLFNLYFTTKRTGTGIGLSIVHQIVSEHNGRINVASLEGETIFEIIIPEQK